jgi:hypothetical protein
MSSGAMQVHFPPLGFATSTVLYFCASSPVGEMAPQYPNWACQYVRCNLISPTNHGVPSDDIPQTRVFVSQIVAELEEAVWECFRIRLEAGHAPNALILALVVLRRSVSLVKY